MKFCKVLCAAGFAGVFAGASTTQHIGAHCFVLDQALQGVMRKVLSTTKKTPHCTVVADLKTLLAPSYHLPGL